MDLDQILRDLKIDEQHREDLARNWSASVASFEDSVYFIEDDYIQAVCAYCQITAAYQDKYLLMAARVRADNALRFFAWHVYQRLVFDIDGPGLSAWPSLEPYLGKTAHTFYMLIMFGAVKHIRKACTDKGVPESIIHDTCFQFQCYSDRNAMAYDDNPGINPGSLSWSRHYLRGDLYRLGRMEFMLKPMPEHRHVLKHKRTSQVLMLLGDQQKMTDEGYYFIDGDRSEWLSVFEESEEAFKGHVISPLGHAEIELQHFKKSEWQCLLKPGDPILDMHIPAGGGMTIEACQESFVEGFKFFDTYFSELGSALAINCVSWIFNPALEDILPQSNLAALIAAGYCYPAPSSGRDGLNFIYGREYDKLDDYPQNTRLEKAFIQKLKNGERLRNGGWLLLREHVDQCADQVYRNQNN